VSWTRLRAVLGGGLLNGAGCHGPGLKALADRPDAGKHCSGKPFAKSDCRIDQCFLQTKLA